MEELKQAIIGTDRKIHCPHEWCRKVNGVVNDGAIIKNYIVRCRGSRRNHNHYFVVNWNGEQKGDVESD